MNTEQNVERIGKYVSFMPQKPAEQTAQMLNELDTLLYLKWQIEKKQDEDFIGYVGTDIWKSNQATLDALKVRVITLISKL